MTKKDLVYVIGIVLVACSVLWFYMKQPRIAYIDLPKVYESFDLKKDLETKYKNVSNARKTILDSLKLQLQQLSLRAGGIKNKESGEFREAATRFSLLKQEYQLKESNFSEGDEALLNQSEKDIWNRINKYSKEFSKQVGINILLGADGSGNVMNVDEKYEVTEDFIKYINAHYQGNEK